MGAAFFFKGDENDKANTDNLGIPLGTAVCFSVGLYAFIGGCLIEQLREILKVLKETHAR